MVQRGVVAWGALKKAQGGAPWTVSMVDMVESRAHVIEQMCSVVMMRWRERSVPVSMACEAWVCRVREGVGSGGGCRCSTGHVVAVRPGHFSGRAGLSPGLGKARRRKSRPEPGPARLSGRRNRARARPGPTKARQSPTGPARQKLKLDLFKGQSQATVNSG